MEVVAIGRTEILYNSIVEIHSGQHDLDLIISCEAEPHYGKDLDDFRQLAERLDIRFMNVSDINHTDVIEKLSTFDVGVSVNWKTIIGGEVLAAPEYGILNYHAGDLPRYRGNAAMNWAILEDESRIVHTIHRMTEQLDAGPIYLQRETRLDEETYIGDVYRDARKLVPGMFTDVLDGIQDDSILPRKQSTDSSDVLRCYPRKPEDSRIDWRQSADRIHRLVRASAEPLFGAYTYYDTTKMRVWRASPEYP
jgi:methionyl-tRNA formyltransferase